MKKILSYYKSISKTTKLHLFFLVLFCLLQVLLITRFKYIFGSNVDWMKQHIVFADYFRNLFYETGNIFSDFTLHLGSGQNIFYIAYYGYLSPIILLSYLLPFVPMSIYIMITSIIIVIVSIILFYYFLRKNQFSNSICFFASLLFLFSSSFIFHSHRHIMFVNYMPFLILGLIGVYRYFEKRRSGLLIISVFLMILTSYYYSIPGIIAIGLYGIYYYFKKYYKNNINFFFKNIISFGFRIIIGILLASILLFPVIYVIVNGRNGSGFTFDFSYLVPKVSLDYLMYGTYGVGLTSILWIGLIYNLLYLNKENKIISLLLTIIISLPIFNLLLNGGLYFNGKIFIPFLPLFLFLIASMIKDIRLNKKSLVWLIFGLLIAFLLIQYNKRELYFIIDMFITIILLFIFQKKHKYLYLFPIVVVSFIISYNNNINDNLVSINDYKKQISYINYDVNNYINKNVDSIYRYQDSLSLANGINFSYGKLDYRTSLYSSTSNQYYWNSFYNNFNNNDMYRNHFMLDQTNNLFFNNFMGIRYLLTNNVPYGYYEIKDYNDGSLYENKNVYPIGFSSSHLLNKQEYDQLPFIEKILSYQKNIIINGSSNNSIVNKEYNKIKLNTKIDKQENVDIQNINNHYIINSKNNGKLILSLKEAIIDKTLVIRFKMNDIPSCKNGDTYITINGIMNKLTCGSWKYYNGNETFDYVLSSNDSISKLEIIFGKGKYDISDIELYEVSNSFFDENAITPLLINSENNNVISGTINQKEDGYFIFTIPYDKGFKVMVDEKEVEIERVNDCFIGFPISSGNHTIELKFNAPYFNLGKIVSISTLFIFIGIIIYEKKKSV